MNSLTGESTVVAGNGTSGFSSDNGPATEAQLNMPWGVAFNPELNRLLIADRSNNRIR